MCEGIAHGRRSAGDFGGGGHLVGAAQQSRLSLGTASESAAFGWPFGEEPLLAPWRTPKVSATLIAIPHTALDTHPPTTLVSSTVRENS